METLIIIGAILVILGIIGSIIPAMPGPVLGYIGLWLLFFAKGAGSVSILSLILFGIAMVVLMLLDYLAPIIGARYFGASKKGIIVSVIGAVIGILFFPPLGIFIGAFIGAVLGEIWSGKELDQSLKAGVGVIFGSITIILLQTIYSIVLAVYFFTGLI
jgi:uncharacterized protein